MTIGSLIYPELGDLLAQGSLNAHHDFARTIQGLLLGFEESNNSSVVDWLRNHAVLVVHRNCRTTLIKSFVKGCLEFRKNVADFIDLVDYFRREQIQLFPCLIKLIDIRHPQAALAQRSLFGRLGEALEAIQRPTDFEFERPQGQIKPQKQSELFAYPLPFCVLAVEVNLCDIGSGGKRGRLGRASMSERGRLNRAPISDCRRPERDQGSHEDLPVLQLEIWLSSRNDDRNDKEYSDGAGCSCKPIKVHLLNPGPLNSPTACLQADATNRLCREG
jgi:hypothetical protein